MTRNQVWAAGLFEGEGTIYLVRHRRGASEWRYAGLSVVSTDRDVLERFRDAMFGYGQIYAEKRTVNHFGKKIVYKWNLRNRPHVAAVIEVLRPWLGERRLARLDEVLAEVTPVIRRPHTRHMKAVHDA